MKRIAVAMVVALSGALAPASAHAIDTCPNAAYRTGAGANLPDCRAWEQATPVEKGGNQVRDFAGMFAGPDGNSVLFYSVGDVGGADGLPYQGVYSSVRDGGWTTAGVGAPLDPPLTGPGVALTTQSTLGLSEDRSKALTASTRKLTPDASEGDSNIYVRDTRSRAYRLAATVPGPAVVGGLTGIGRSLDSFYGASPGMESSVVKSELELEPNAQGGGLYLVRNGRLTLVNRGLDDNPLPGVTTLDAPGSGPRVVSDDGRRVTFRAPDAINGVPALYQRVDGTTTKLISRSYRQADGPDAAVAVGPPDTAVWPSADGREVTFATAGETTLNEDGRPATIYRWDADRDAVTDVFDGVTRPWGSNALGFRLRNVSPGGRYVWFTFRDDDAGTSGLDELAVLDRQEKRIAIKATAPSEFIDATRFSADGTKLLMRSSQPLTGYDQSSGPCASTSAGSCAEAFYVDATDSRTEPVCASCGPAGTSSVGDAGLGIAFPGRPTPTVVTDSGRAVFQTPQRLVPEDVNGQLDVYAFTPGRPAALLSGGTGRYPSTVVGTSASGDDAFFATGNALVAQDEDRGAIDIYDARVGGGLAEQQRGAGLTDSCPTANCPALQPSAPALEVPGTSTFSAPARPPAFRVGPVSAAARRAAVSSGRLKVPVTVGAPGRLSARATARIGRRTSTIGTAATSVRKAGRYSLSLALSRSSRRALKRGDALRVRLSVSYSRASEPATQTFALARPARSSKGGSR